MTCGIISSVCCLIVGAQFFMGIGRFLLQQIILPYVNNKQDFKKYGKWALITGSTDGIGKEYAKALAKRGLNIVLVSRTQSKLDAVAKEIQEQFNVETKTIAVNFTASVEIYEVIKEKIRGLEIGILVNNVGMAYTAPDYFLSVPDREKLIQDMIQCNALSIPMMTNLILPQMVERRRGLIVNISSLSAIVPAGCMSIYSATKAFAHKFSEDLQMEYRKDNIIVQSVLPGPVATNMTKMKKGSLMAPKPDVYVESTLKTVGHADYTTGYVPHMILNFVVFLFNFVAPEMLAKTTLKTMENVRNRGIKKGFYTPAN